MFLFEFYLVENKFNEFDNFKAIITQAFNDS